MYESKVEKIEKHWFLRHKRPPGKNNNRCTWYLEDEQRHNSRQCQQQTSGVINHIIV